MLRGVIFDLGSTLIRYTGEEQDTLAHMRADLSGYLLAAGLPFEPDAFLTTFAVKLDEFYTQRLHDWVEVTAAFVLRQTLGALGLPPPTDGLIEGALKAYFAYSEARWQPMPDAHATLERLAGEGYRLGLISNAGDDGNVQRLIDNAGLRRWLDPILVSAAVGLRKPNPRIFRMALEAWGLPAQEVAMVGDTLGADILGAQLSGLRSVWIASRSDTPANQAHDGNIRPEATIDSLAELHEALSIFGGIRNV